MFDRLVVLVAKCLRAAMTNPAFGLELDDVLNSKMASIERTPARAVWRGARRAVLRGVRRAVGRCPGC